jgi:hypothetical protein
MKFALSRINTTITKKQNIKTHTSSTKENILHTKCFSGFRQYLI